MAESYEGFTEKTGKVREKVFVTGVTVEEEVSDRRHLRWTKTIVTLGMAVLVAFMNWGVVDMLNHVIDEELRLIRSGFMRAEDRSITTGVYMALIGGTVAEVSALFFIIVKSMFK
ncbi:hypothetical protein ACJ8M3_24695 [Serratia sp. CY55921]|uniref:hypothetical protein n=1 Tax=Serratia sp. CY55921 TaxID=3383640 RepID=UPI003F9EFF24